MAEPGPADYEAAERLVREAHARAEEAAARAAAGEVPPNGWAAAGDRQEQPPFPDLSALYKLLDGAIPPELARRLADALRELLIVLRAIIDYSIARLERAEPESRSVEDIPIQ
jgi:hypothetical protein